MGENWLTDAFLSRVLQSVEKTQQEVKVIQLQYEPVVPAGISFSSFLYRIHVEYMLDQGVKTTSLVVKRPLDSGEQKMILDKCGAYKTECKVYCELLPKMYKYKNLMYTAKSYFCPLEESLVLEDLKTSGFVMADRLKQLDFHHCRLVLERMAEMHALSVAVHRDFPELLPSTGAYLLFNDNFTEEEKNHMRLMDIKLVTPLVEVIDNVEGCSNYSDLICDDISTHWDKTTKLFKPSDNNFNVFNMGDLWTNNLMFKYNDNGQVVDLRFVDFQNSLYTTFTFDLSYFWWSSANEYVREYHREELFEVYRQSLNRTLYEIGCSTHLSKEEFDRQMKATKPFVIYILYGLLPVAMAQPDDFVVFNDLPAEQYYDAPNRKNLQSKYFKDNIAKTLQQIYKYGLLE